MCDQAIAVFNVYKHSWSHLEITFAFEEHHSWRTMSRLCDVLSYDETESPYVEPAKAGK